MKAYFYGFILNLQFFTTLPIPLEVPMNDKNIERSIRLFPVLGLFFGVIYAFVGYSLQKYTPFSNLVITFFVWLLTIILTGGIHIDGWIDSADGFFSYREKEKRLEIMTDPRVGAFGVIGAIVLLFAKFIFIYELLMNSSSFTFLYMMLIPILSRTLMAFTLILIPNAKSKGLGHLFQNAKTESTLSFYFLYLLISLSLVFIDWTIFTNFLILFSTVILAFFWIKKKAVQWFGGITGDLVGAATEGVEVLLWLVLLLLHYFGMA